MRQRLSCLNHPLLLTGLFFISSFRAISAYDPVVISTLPVTDVASSDFQTVCEHLRAVTLVQADFAEEKTLNILTHPIASTGTLLFSPKSGVYRVTLTPIHQELLITRSQFIQKDAQGNVQRMSVQRQPVAQAFVDVFLSFFAGDKQAWERTFEAFFSGSLERWRIVFLPRHNSPAAKAIRKIVFEGHDGIVDEISLIESNGDGTHTIYTHQRVSQGVLAESDQRFPADLATP